LDTREVSVAE